MTFVFSCSLYVHVQHKTIGVRLTIVIIPPLTLTLKQGHLQKATTIRARLLKPVHRIFYRPSALLGHPNIAQIGGG
jgi:hypothetical protein